MDEERISDADMEYHDVICRDVQIATIALDRAKAAGTSWFEFLKRRYRLNDDDIVEPDGRIHRVPILVPDEEVKEATD